MEIGGQRKIVFIILIIAVVGFGYYFFGRISASAILANDPRISFKNIPADMTGWGNYTDAQRGFSFSYPGTLNAIKSEGNDAAGAYGQVELNETVRKGNYIESVDRFAIQIRPADQISVLKPMGNVVSKQEVPINGRSVTIYSSVIIATGGGAGSSESELYAVFAMGGYAYAVSVDQKYSDDLYSVLSSFHGITGGQ